MNQLMECNEITFTWEKIKLIYNLPDQQRNHQRWHQM
jgi:hypothetical protein